MGKLKIAVIGLMLGNTECGAFSLASDVFFDEGADLCFLCFE